MKRTLQSCCLSALCALVGLCVVLVVGRIWWDVGSGVAGILQGAVIGGGAAFLLRLRYNLVTSIVASTFGAAVACFLAIATAEQLPPGSTEWMLKGGLYGASTGLPLAFMLGPFGLIETNTVQAQPQLSAPDPEDEPRQSSGGES